jgi:cytoskeletal protein RodZ
VEISGGLPIMDIGKILQDARIAKNVSLDTAAQETNIRRNYLEAIENNDFASLPGAVFVKGIMRTYGNYLGLDGAKLVEEFKTSLSGNTAVNNNAIRESKDVRVRPSFKSNRDIGSGTDSNRNLFLLILCGVLVLLLAAGGVYYYLNRSGQGIELSVPFLSDTVNKPKTEAKENSKADDSSQKKEAERSASGHLAADDKNENLSASAKEKNGVTVETTAAKKEESTIKEKDGAAILKKRQRQMKKMLRSILV